MFLADGRDRSFGFAALDEAGVRCRSSGVSVANPPDGADAPPPATWTMISAPPLAAILLDHLVGPLDSGDVGADELVRGDVLDGVPADRGEACPGAFRRAATAAPVPRVPPVTSARLTARLSVWMPDAVVMVR
jgi:hypothetical protein